MNTLHASAVARILTLAAAVCLAGCDYDLPLTPTATRPVETRLLGDWISKDGDEAITLKVRRLDAETYVVVCDGDLYRAQHSDLDGTAFVSVQELESDARKYAFLTWALSADGATLTLRVVSSEVIPGTLRDTAGLHAALRQHRHHPKLLGDEIVFTRPKI